MVESTKKNIGSSFSSKSLDRLFFTLKQCLSFFVFFIRTEAQSPMAKWEKVLEKIKRVFP
jgi:hypothetical protein